MNKFTRQSAPFHKLNLLLFTLLLCTFLFSSNLLYSQRISCEEPTTFPFTEIPESTQCEQLSGIEFDLYVGAGTPITHSSQISLIPSHEIRVVGNFIIDNNFLLPNSIVMIDPNVSIVIQEGAHLTIDNSTLF